MLILTSCSNYKNQDSKIAYNEKIEELKKLRLQEEFHLFVNRDFMIYFPYAIDFIDIKSISLLDSNKVIAKVEDLERIQIVDKNKISIKLHEPISYFDSIKIVDNLYNSISLSTGQYFFEGELFSDDIPEVNRVYFRGSHLKQEGERLIYITEFTNNAESEILFYLPVSIERIVNSIELKTIERKRDIIRYEYSFGIPKSYLEKNALTDINFEIIVAQKYKDSKRT